MDLACFATLFYFTIALTFWVVGMSLALYEFFLVRVGGIFTVSQLHQHVA
jgi:hypothetical protein